MAEYVSIFSKKKKQQAESGEGLLEYLRNQDYRTSGKDTYTDPTKDYRQKAQPAPAKPTPQPPKKQPEATPKKDRLYDVNLGSFKGSGLLEDFINSPAKVKAGLDKVKRGDFKAGYGDVVTGAIEGPLGLLPIAKVGQVASKTASAGSKGIRGFLQRSKPAAIQGAKEGAVYGGVYGGASAASQDASLPQIATQAGFGTVLGGAGGAAVGAGATGLLGITKKLFEKNATKYAPETSKVPASPPSIADTGPAIPPATTEVGSAKPSTPTPIKVKSAPSGPPPSPAPTKINNTPVAKPRPAATSLRAGTQEPEVVSDTVTKPVYVASSADVKLVYPEAKKLPDAVRATLPSENVDSNNLKPTDLSSLGVDFKRSDMKALVRELPDLKRNPVMVVRKADDGTVGFSYKGKGKVNAAVDFTLNPVRLGLNQERLKAANLREGQTIDISEVMTGKGKAPAVEKDGKLYSAAREERVPGERFRDEKARSPAELKELADQLNKAGQANAILRRGGVTAKGKLGYFSMKKDKEFIGLKDDVIKSPKQYVQVLAHELSHAIEHTVNGNTKSTYKLFGDLAGDELPQIDRQLRAIVNKIEGEDIARSRPGYYYKPTEMLARYIETTIIDPNAIDELAPLVKEKFELAVIKHPEIAELMEAIKGNIDRKFRNATFSFWRDLRQTYQKHLGKRVGDLAYDAEIVRRAESQRAQKAIKDLVKIKFKGVKDDPALLFRAAEGIKTTTDGIPQYGTRDFVNIDIEDTAAIAKAEKAGYVLTPATKYDNDGDRLVVMAKTRYTSEQAEEAFKQLSPQGQKLVKDFTEELDEARDLFNRNVVKDTYEIDANLEGWVHRGLRENKGVLAGFRRKSLNQRTAGLAKQRKAESGHMEDFRKQMEKALLEAETTRIDNDFVKAQLARISKPIAKGQQPDKDWVEVTADMRKGLKLPGENQTRVMVGAKSFATRAPKYQVPRELVEHYRLIRQLPEELNSTAKVMNNLGRYWAVNVLTHGGSIGTNFLSGGLQYAAKVVNDLYMDAFTLSPFTRTKRNLAAPLAVLTPRGWQQSPDWLYGGHRSNFAGQFMEQGVTSQGINKYGDVLLKPYSTVEAYWKKAIAYADGSKNIQGLTIGKSVNQLNKTEKELIAEINKSIDLFAFDYDNVPVWIDAFGRKGGGVIKPFIKYPYKYMKMLANLASASVDRSLPWQERLSKTLTLSTFMAATLAVLDRQEAKQETPKGTDKTPAALDPAGRVLSGKEDGIEVFTRLAKYPFLNIATSAKAALSGDTETAGSILKEQIGSLGPVGDLVRIGILDARNKYEQFTPREALLGKLSATYIPGFRIFADFGNLTDDYKRRPETFLQGLGQSFPIPGSEETKRKFRGEVRSVDIPIEPESRSISKKETTSRELRNVDKDVLLSALTGIYRTRIDPKEAKQQALRDKRNAAEKRIRELLRGGKEDQALSLADEAGLIISDRSLKYYRRNR